MPLLGINPGRGQVQKESTLDKILKGVSIANNVLGTALAVPEYLQKRDLLKAQTANTLSETENRKDMMPLAKAKIEKETNDLAPISEEAKKALMEAGVPEAMVPKTVGEAQGLYSKTYETPAQKASRINAEATLNLLKAKTGLETRKAERELARPLLTPAEEKVDTEFAQQYADWKASGGYAQATKNLSQAKRALRDLLEADKRGKNFSGKDVGLVEGKVRSAMFPEAADMEERVAQTVIMNLRQALGPQFTETEGRRIMSQTYNPMLDEKVNAQRLEALINQLQEQFDAKQHSSEYYEKNGTLKGWTPPTRRPSDDIINKIKAPEVDDDAIQREMRKRGMLGPK